MRLLVTGCAGFIGSHTCDELLADGHEVLGVDCFNENYGRRQKLRNLERARDWAGFDFVPVDLARGDLDDLVADCEAVVHLAAEPGVRPSFGPRFERYLRNNVLATQHLLDAVSRRPALRLVYASSSSIYGDAAVQPTPEDVAPAPRSPYGTTKLAGEHLCETYRHAFGVDAVRLRLFTVYGPRQRPDMAFARFLAAARAGGPIEVYGDGLQRRDFTHVADVVAAVRAAATRPELGGRVFNVGGGSAPTVRDVLALIAEVAGCPLDLHFRPARSGDVRATLADATAARRDLGWAPAVPLPDGLAGQWAWALGSAPAHAPA